LISSSASELSSEADPRMVRGRFFSASHPAERSMKKAILRIYIPALLSALLPFAGCAGREKIRPPAPAAADVVISAKIDVPDKKAPADAHDNKTPAALKTTRPLFVIERNKNANVVHYEASLTADGNLDPKEPVVAYWVMLAEDGSRKKLNWLEKKKAYGIRFKQDGPPNSYTMTLAAAPQIPLAVKKTGEVVRAEGVINGRQAVLEKMFIQAHNKFLGTKVEYIELYGKDLKTGEACSEKIIPK